MTTTLYNRDILRLAASIPHQRRLDHPQASAERRSPVCGSRVSVDVVLDGDGRVVALGQEVKACALGQASAALMGGNAIGRTGAELGAARDALAAYLGGERDDPGEWPGLALFAEARRFTARHKSILLAFEAAAEAAEQAQGRLMQGATSADTAALVLRDGVIILGAAMGFVMLFRRLGLGAVLGYLVAGALIGPSGLRLVTAPEEMIHIADFGIVLLLFLVGLELHPSRLLRLRNEIFGLGLLQVTVAGLAISAVVFYATGFSAAASIAIGLPLALSSTAQVLPSLRADGSINTKAGERAFSVLLFQDLSIVPLITIIAALSRAPVDTSAPPGWQLGLYTILAIAGLVLAGKFVINPLFRLVGRISERELFIVAGLFIVLASAAVMEALHLSTALGAFIAGVMLADSPYRHELEADIDPFRSILLGLFFVSVGMMLDLQAIWARPLFVLAMAAALIAVKASVLYGLARAFGMDNRKAVKLGLLLSQGGEFGFVLFAQASNAMLVAPEAASLFSAIVTVSMATTPFLMMFNDWLDRRSNRRGGDGLDGPEKSEPSSAIVIGYGRFGQTVSQMLMAKGIEITLIDSKPSQIEISGSFGRKVYYGDGTRVDLLRLAGAAEARALLFCIDGNHLDRKRLEPILAAFPQAAIFVRAFDRLHLMELAPLDLECTIREIFESAVAMGREALALFCIDRAEVDRVEQEYRARDIERLDSQTASGDLHSMSETMFGPDNPLADAAQPIETPRKSSTSESSTL